MHTLWFDFTKDSPDTIPLALEESRHLPSIIVHTNDSLLFSTGLLRLSYGEAIVRSFELFRYRECHSAGFKDWLEFCPESPTIADVGMSVTLVKEGVWSEFKGRVGLVLASDEDMAVMRAAKRDSAFYRQPDGTYKLFDYAG